MTTKFNRESRSAPFSDRCLALLKRKKYRWKEEQRPKELEKKFQGSPFGSQSLRTDVATVHPEWRRPGSYTGCAYDRKVLTPGAQRLGPGLYNVAYGDFSRLAMMNKLKSPGWSRELEVERMSKMPHLLYRDQYYKLKQQEEWRGPGHYATPDSFKVAAEKPSSIRGMLDTLSERFTVRQRSSVPGPGTYGEGGVPSRVMEKEAMRSASTIPLMGSRSNLERTKTLRDSGLGPGSYTSKGSIQNLMEKSVTERGPYDLFTAERSEPIKFGFQSMPKYNCRNATDGDCDHNSIALDLLKKENLKKGRFAVVEQYPWPPGERIYYANASQCPRNPDDPSPCRYELSVKRGERPTTGGGSYPFNKRAGAQKSGSRRGTALQPGPGRYEPDTFEKHQHKNGHTNLFLSSTWKPSYEESRTLMERLAPKRLPKGKEMFTLRPKTAAH